LVRIFLGEPLTLSLSSVAETVPSLIIVVYQLFMMFLTKVFFAY